MIYRIKPFFITAIPVNCFFFAMVKKLEKMLFVNDSITKRYEVNKIVYKQIKIVYFKSKHKTDN